MTLNYHIDESVSNVKNYLPALGCSVVTPNCYVAESVKPGNNQHFPKLQTFRQCKHTDLCTHTELSCFFHHTLFYTISLYVAKTVISSQNDKSWMTSLYLSNRIGPPNDNRNGPFSCTKHIQFYNCDIVPQQHFSCDHFSKMRLVSSSLKHPNVPYSFRHSQLQHHTWPDSHGASSIIFAIHGCLWHGSCTETARILAHLSHF